MKVLFLLAKVSWNFSHFKGKTERNFHTKTNKITVTANAKYYSLEGVGFIASALIERESRKKDLL